LDVLAHALWVGVGTTLASRRSPLSRRTFIAAIAMAVLPDVVQVLPIAAWVLFGEGTLSTLVAYTLATPGTDPALSSAVAQWTYHFHCVMHSAVVAGGVTFLLWMKTRSVSIPLLAWWSHIVIDVFTHSAAFYPVPVLYPFTMRGFDGIAWNSPWFQALNYGLLGAAFIYLMRTRRRS
jgi:hypothetical protein